MNDFSFDTSLRIITILIFFFWWVYWLITEKKADTEKPKRVRSKTSVFLQKLVLRVAQSVLMLQLLGFPLFLFPEYSLLLQSLGFLFVIGGVSVSISARRTLGSNWAHAIEYQVKKKQTLVTIGVYGVIRHPIYAGLCVAFVGGELVAQSYLVFAVPLLLLVGYLQARREEALLIRHFGSQYVSYQKRTKMFIPFVI